MRHFAHNLGFLWFFFGVAFLLILAFSTRLFQGQPEDKSTSDLRTDLGELKREVAGIKEAIREKKR